MPSRWNLDRVSSLSTDRDRRILNGFVYRYTIYMLSGGTKRDASNEISEAVYYAVLGYEEAGRCSPKGDLDRVRALAVSIGLISDKELTTRGSDLDEQGR